MADDWKREEDDPEWSLNVSTFIRAALESFDGDPDANRLDGLSIRCRTSVCRLDLQGDLDTLGKLFTSSREQQLHATHHIGRSDGGAVTVEAYLGRELADPGDAQ
jgi:hypothetical protein